MKNSSGTSLATYTYDSLSRGIGRVVATSVPTGSSMLWIYDGWSPIAEYSANNLSKTDSWGQDHSGGMQGAGGFGGLLSETQISAFQLSTFSIWYDGNGNVTEYLDNTGATAAHFEYDATSNLHYYGYRCYDATSGRWINRDPIEEEGGINLYGFVRNDGVGKWDILGLAGQGMECLESVDHLMKNSQLVKNVVSLIKKNGYDVPPIVCACCKGFGGKSQESSDVFSGGLVLYICYKRTESTSDSVFEERLHHELYHSLQSCKGTLNEKGKSKCENSLCEEIEAFYNTSNCRFFKNEESRKSCIKGVYGGRGEARQVALSSFKEMQQSRI